MYIGWVYYTKTLSPEKNNFSVRRRVLKVSELSGV